MIIEQLHLTAIKYHLDHKVFSYLIPNSALEQPLRRAGQVFGR